MALPEAGLINCEITIRDMQLTQDVRMTRKSLVRWLALSMGLVSQNETRTVVLDVLEALFYFHFAEGRHPDVSDLMGFMESDLQRTGENEKAVRYHLLQLQNLGLIERKKGKYSFSVSPLSEKGDFASTIDFVFKRRCDIAVSKMKDAGRELSYTFSKRREPQVELVQYIRKPAAAGGADSGARG